MFSRKEVLATGIDASLEIGYAREPGETRAVKIALPISIQQL
jgi:hypothetical protein